MVLKTYEDIKLFVKKFEEGRVSKDEWHHYQHLVMAVWYLEVNSFDVALEKSRKGIVFHNKVNGIKQTRLNIKISALRRRYFI